MGAVRSPERRSHFILSICRKRANIHTGPGSHFGKRLSEDGPLEGPLASSGAKLQE